MALLIPTQSTPYYTINVSLDGITYQLGFSYSTREECWYMNVNNENSQPVLLGTKIVCQYPLFPYQQAFYQVPQGIMIAMSGTDDNSTPGLNDFGIGKRVQLFYYTVDEILAGA